MSAQSSTTADARYRALADHCDDCRECNADTSQACPQAHQLRRAWSRARRGVSA